MNKRSHSVRPHMRNLVRSLLRSLTTIGLLALIGCEVGGSPDAGLSICPPGEPTVRCDGDEAIACLEDGREGGRRDCTEVGDVCVPGAGCRPCRPGAFRCDGDGLALCDATGAGYEHVATCDPELGEVCRSALGACVRLCDEAVSTNSYVGCDYWPITSMNTSVESEFGAAVAVANPYGIEARITLSRAGEVVNEVIVPGGGAVTVDLPWVAALKGNPPGEEQWSALVPQGAYHLESNVPVSVYQFNPLEYWRETGLAAEFSFSNDASLLLPSHVMTGEYTVLSWPTRMSRMGGGTPESNPGFFTVVGVGNAPVTVSVQYGGHARGGVGVAPGGPGDIESFVLEQGDALQIVGATPAVCSVGFDELLPGSPPTVVEYCTVGAEYDLSGTRIRADGPVQVTAGHDCAFVPYNRWACDHLEETLFPEGTWGREAIVSVTRPLRGEPNIVRIMSGSDGNIIDFDPAPTGIGSSTLNRGAILEFETWESFRVRGSAPLQVAQFLVGQDYGGARSSGSMGQGDPAMSLAVPTAQFRTQYTFFAPVTYTTNYVNVTAPLEATVTLDAVPVRGFSPVGATGFGVSAVEILGGRHTITSDQPFGIVVYGFGAYTSYMYPGGLDLDLLF